MRWANQRWKLASAAAATVVLLMYGASAAQRRGKAPAAPPPVPPGQIQVFGGGPAPFARNARSQMLIEAHSGQVLYAYNEHLRMQPASLAKILTLHVTLEALKNGKITVDTSVNISEKAWRLSVDQTVSKMFLEVGQRVPVKALLYGMMVSSGNDAAMALAEYLGGSEEGFVAIMNDYCRQLGLEESHFGSPDGLPVPGQYTTAADMVKLARLLIQRFPESLTYTAVKEYTFHQITQRNWNTLLFYDPRVDGIKTGYVAEAGYHLVATAHADNVRLISALMGAPNAEKRRTETEKLLAWAFRSFVNLTPDWRPLVPASLPVYEGRDSGVALAPPGPVFITVAKGEEKNIKVSASLETSHLVAPVQVGTKVGSLTVRQDDRTLLIVPIKTQSAVPRGNLFKVAWGKIALSFHRIADGIMSAMWVALRKILSN